MTFATLRAACVAHGLYARLDIFDCGEIVRVIKDGADICRFTVECGDGPDSASQVAANWLIDKGFLSQADFEARDSARTHASK